MAWVLASSDRFFITHFLGLSKNGVYSSSYVLGGILVLFYYPIGFMLFPAISKSWEQNKKDDVKNYVEYSIKLFLTFAIPAAAGLIILSQPILKIMTSSEYLAGWQLVLLVCVGTIFYDIAQINTYIIYLVKKTKWTLFATTISAIICASLEYFLIPKIGIMGGAVATIVSYFLFAFIVILLARKIISYHVNLVYLGKVSIATFLMVLFVYFLKADSILRIIVAVIGGAAIFAGAILLLKTLSEQDKRLIKQFISGFLLKKNEKSE
jgi:O-antigen/teichoic acid export membrane protein